MRDVGNGLRAGENLAHVAQHALLAIGVEVGGEPGRGQAGLVSKVEGTGPCGKPWVTTIALLTSNTFLARTIVPAQAVENPRGP